MSDLSCLSDSQQMEREREGERVERRERESTNKREKERGWGVGSKMGAALATYVSELEKQ